MCSLCTLKLKYILSAVKYALYVHISMHDTGFRHIKVAVTHYSCCALCSLFVKGYSAIFISLFM